LVGAAFPVETDGRDIAIDVDKKPRARPFDKCMATESLWMIYLCDSLAEMSDDNLDLDRFRLDGMFE
jgi:hypothetical protein